MSHAVPPLKKRGFPYGDIMKTNIKTTLLHGAVFFACCLIMAATGSTAMAENTRTAKEISLPPPVKIQYVVRVKYAALSIGGTSTITWEHHDNEYAIHTRARANMLGTVLVSSSKGKIGPNGLQPEVFTEKRINRDETSTTFDHHKRTLTFSGSEKSLPFADDIQDRSSAIWQLVLLARTSPEKFEAGSKINLEVVGRSQVDKWTIEVIGRRSILAHLGSIDTVYLYKEDDRGKKTEAWLAPDQEWYPVKLNFIDEKDFRIEQNFQKYIID